VLGWAAYALTEVRKYLIPDSNDEIRQEQMREMELIRQVLLEQQGFTKGLSHKILIRDLGTIREATSTTRLLVTAGIGNKRRDARK
jgi:hypothetical protein